MLALKEKERAVKDQLIHREHCLFQALRERIGKGAHDERDMDLHLQELQKVYGSVLSAFEAVHPASVTCSDSTCDINTFQGTADESPRFAYSGDDAAK
eukprot:scaffold766_cov560-Prasinococcus_capsulatus_cf.AAC.4